MPLCSDDNARPRTYLDAMKSIVFGPLVHITAITVLMIHLTALAWFSWNNPIYTWDVVPYVAIALESDFENFQEIHQETYQLLQQSLSNAQYSSLISGEYARTVYEDPQSFSSQLNMYRIKPLYTMLLKGLVSIGLNMLDAILLVSIVPGLFICLLLYTWLRRYSATGISVLVIMLFSIGARLFDLSRIPTPDNLSALLLLIGVWCLAARERYLLAVLFFVLSIWTRTNNILLIVPLLIFVSWNLYNRDDVIARRLLCWNIIGIGLAVTSYVWISYRFDYQWWRLFSHTMIAPIPDLAEFTESFSVTQYANVLESSLMQLISLDPATMMFDTSLLVFILLWMIAWINCWRECLHNLLYPDRPVGVSEISLLCIPVIGVFLSLFPLIPDLDRFLTAYYAILTVFAVKSFCSGKKGSA